MRFRDGEPAWGTLSHITQNKGAWRAILRGHLPPGRTTWPVEGTVLEVNGTDYDVTLIEDGVSFEPTAFIIAVNGVGPGPPGNP